MKKLAVRSAEMPEWSAARVRIPRTAARLNDGIIISEKLLVSLSPASSAMLC